MTREEAIQVLKEYRTIVMNCLEAETPAFDMAIEALQAEETMVIQTGQTHGKSAYIYCGECGARMKGGAE